jgi:hypothetical protein
MFMSLGMYDSFEVPFLEQTELHYQAEGAAYMESSDVRHVALPAAVD